MNAKVPDVTVGLDHLRLAGEVAFLVLHIAAADFGLKVAGEFDAVRRVHVDHLDLAGQVLTARQRRHDLK